MSEKIKVISTDVIQSSIITIQLPNFQEFKLYYDEKRKGLIIFEMSHDKKHIKVIKDFHQQIFIK